MEDAPVEKIPLESHYRLCCHCRSLVGNPLVAILQVFSSPPFPSLFLWNLSFLSAFLCQIVTGFPFSFGCSQSIIYLLFWSDGQRFVLKYASLADAAIVLFWSMPCLLMLMQLVLTMVENICRWIPLVPTCQLRSQRTALKGINGVGGYWYVWLLLL